MLTKNFTQLNRNDADIAGGKGASLGEMIQAGIPVPPGFVVLAGTFEKFLEETDLNVEVNAVLETVDHNAMHTVEDASEKIQALIKAAQMPKDIAAEIEKEFVKLDAEFVAVRSSATAEDGAENAWAGQLDSYLNTTQDKLLEKVQHCWASLFTPRAIFYRFEKNLHKQKISVAVVVQKMVASEISGIAFSVHPVTEDYNQLIIEAGFGLGEAIVSGSITPDSYVVEKEPRNILDINVSTQTRGLYRAKNGGNQWRDIAEPQASSQVLTSEQILELSEIILGIEKHYGFPCDIEWAFESGKFYIVQSRPITTLTDRQDSGTTEIKKDVPDFIRNIEFFISRPQTVQRDEIIPIFLKKIKPLEVGVVSIPLEGFNRAVYLEESVNKVYHQLLEDMDTPQKFQNHLQMYAELKKEYAKAIEIFCKIGTKKEDLRSAFEHFLVLLDMLAEYAMAPFAIEKILDPMFRERLESEFGEEAWEIMEAIASPTKLIKHQEMQAKIYGAIIEKKDFDQAAEELLQEFFWYLEYSYVEKLYDKDFFLAELNKYTPAQAKEEKKRLEQTMIENTKNLALALKKIQDPTTQLYAQIINNYTFLRTDRIDTFKELQVSLRHVFAQIAESLKQETGEVWSMAEIVSMTNDEITAYLSDISMPNKIQMSKRAKRYVYCCDARGIQIFTEEDMMQKIVEAVEASVNHGQEIRGLTTFKGVVTGRVAIVFSGADLHKVTEESVLVGRTTQVDYISAMKKAVAFVTDEGGVTSHAAIVARELKKPCIVGTGNATKVLHDGDLVEVDADNGVVRIIETVQRSMKPTVIAEIGEWNKVWTTEYSLFSVWLFANQYIDSCKELLGIGFERVILQTEGDLASLYRNSGEQKKFIKEIGKKFLDDAFRNDAFKNLRAGKIRFENYFKLSPKKFLTPKNIEDFIALHNTFIPFFIAVIWAAEALKDQDVSEKIKEEIFKECETIRKENENMYPRLEKFLRDSFMYIAQKENIDEKLLNMLLPSELIAYTREEKLPNLSILKTRYVSTAVDARVGKCVLLVGKDAGDLINEISSPKDNSSCEKINGSSAFPGIIVGKARLVFRDKEQSKVKEGDILVTTMTRPQWIPAMKRAGAFVTDAGGVLSHAAIIAREMKKPCVIGTKSATSILHDGDLVEVDADSGVVLILQKAQSKSEEELIEIAKDLDWHHWIDRVSHPFTTTLYFSGASPEYFTKVGMDGLGFRSILYQFPIIYQSEKLTKFNYDLLGEYFSRKTIFDVSKSLEKIHSQNKKQLHILLKNKKLSPIEKLLEVREMVRLYFPFLWILLPMERYFNEKLAVEVPKYVQGDTQKFIGDANIPEKKNEYVKMLDMLNSDASLEEVQKKFGWMKCRDAFSDLYTIEDLQEIQKNFKAPEKHDVKIPKQLEKLFSEIKELTYFRTDRTDKYYEMLVLVRPILQEVAAQIGVSFHDLANYDSGSVIAGKPKKMNEEFSYLRIDSQDIVRNEPIIEFSLDLNAEIKGMVAYKGIARGVAKIVHHSSELDKVKKGDILISQMTFPSFISAMQKAAAFVTDEGSITCHAAIIAREMKKPCIIGTKNATKILHDGDLVEVDANEGIVQIIQNAPQEYRQIFNRTIDMSGCELWDLGERIELPKICDNAIYFDPLFYYQSGKGVSVFYNFSDPKQQLTPLVEYFNQHTERLFELKKPFDAACQKIRKILKNKNTEDAPKLFDLITKTWPLIVSSNILGDDSRENVFGVDEKLIDEYINIRKESDGVSHLGEVLLVELIRDLVPNEYKKLAEFLKYSEVDNGKLPEISELQKRKSHYIYHKGEIHVDLTLDEYAKKNNLHIVTHKDRIDLNEIENEIKGQAAYKGIQRGIVKVVFEKKDITKVKKGDIMVTPMTTPDLISAMQKASAFVTDEGGITCHASIIAREMAKPCIIGTKIATEILNDGDLVEVDANKGIVKIIKKAE